MIYLVGAGPGDGGLITCRGMEVLKSCDVVIYDSLGTNELLEEVPDNCRKIYVGKRAGEHYKKQEEINRILIDAAKKYETVVRLKGGDPFVFGRGGEEILELEKNKIPYQVIPGVTSAIAVPELAGIPVTHRETSRSFHVYTGHTNSDEKDMLSHIHPQEGTCVYLMGLGNLEGIVKKLTEQGKNEDTPVAVISCGTLPNETVVRGTLKNIVQRVNEKHIIAPAIIVVGDTADYNLKCENAGILSGIKIGVVGTKHLREKMGSIVKKSGASLYSICNMEVVSTDEQIENLEKELMNIDRYKWVGFTSCNSIRIFFKTVKRLHIDLRRFASVKFAVVGSGTAEALEREGFTADYMPKEYTTEAMARGLLEVLNKEEKLLLPRAARGSTQMSKILTEGKKDVTIIPVYDVEGRKTNNWKYLNDFDVITFASKSGVEAFVGQFMTENPGMMGKPIGQFTTENPGMMRNPAGQSTVENISRWEKERRKSNILVAAIGAVTAKALEEYGIKADIVPKQCDIQHMIDDLKKTLETR